MNQGFDYIERTLHWLDADLKLHHIKETEIRQFSQPMVILGVPGMGKTRLMQRLGAEPECRFVSATSFLRQPDTILPQNECLVIDGLDEVAAVEESDPLHNVLKKLLACGKPRFILSCREAEWRGNTARADISDDYGVSPLQFYLEPLSYQEALTALSQKNDAGRAKTALKRLDEVGLSDLYANPLTLNFIDAILAAHEDIPETRANLYQQAVAQLRLEQNDRHKKSTLARLSLDDALDAAGAAMAAMLLTGKDAVSVGSHDDSAIAIAELDSCIAPKAAEAVLGSNLFRRIETEADHFRPLHRTVAEFLGARWLSRMLEKHPHPKQAMARLFALIMVDGGVPASLRGLAAWMPFFSSNRLGPNIIASDPYAVLRYGDADSLTVGQASQMLDALQALSKFDPYFRSDNWSRFSAKGLVQIELETKIRDLILHHSTAVHLRSIILECLAGAPLALKLRDDLHTIIVNPTFKYGERLRSVETIANEPDASSFWPSVIQKLIGIGDEDSTRIAVETIKIIGPDHFDPEIIVDAIVADSGVFPEANRKQHITVGTYIGFQRLISDNCLVPILDALTARLLPYRDKKQWWKYEQQEGWHEIGALADHLIRRQLELDASSVTPQQLWDWMRTLEREREYDRDDRKGVAEILKNDDRLRLGIQRLALFEPGTEDDFHARHYHLNRLSNGLDIQDSDARILLAELVERNNPAEKERWFALVGRFRGEDKLIPKAIQKIARPFAGENQQLLDFLIKKPKRKPLEDWEREDRRDRRRRDRTRLRHIAKAREDFAQNIEAVKAGEYRWIYKLSLAYLGMFSEFRNDMPRERIAEWLGEELCEAALVGFEAVLHRSDLPTVVSIAESYAASRRWNFIYPMLAGAGRRLLANEGFEDLPKPLLSALIMGSEQEQFVENKGFENLSESLLAALRPDADAYEEHIRQKFEPMLRANLATISGLYSFVRAKEDRPLSTRLSVEWLETFPSLPLEVEKDLAGCLAYAPPPERDDAWAALRAIMSQRLRSGLGGQEREAYWRSVQFLLDFDSAIQAIPAITSETKDWLWTLSQFYYARFSNSIYLEADIRQMLWLVVTFRPYWPAVERPGGTTSGDKNPWDASALLSWAIFEIAKNPSSEATIALATLRNMPTDGYTETVQAAVAQQRRVRLETNFRSPDISALKAVIEGMPPCSASDVQAIVLDELAALQERLRGDPLNIVNNFYTERGNHKDENACRDQMLIGLGKLPYNIQIPPEFAMPQGNRSDTAFVYHDISVPLEAKGQWHREVWNAASGQLDRLYATDYRASGKGIYLVFWFGEAAPLQSPPKGIGAPKAADEMEQMLRDLLPVDQSSDIAIVVLDVTRPAKTKR